MDDLGILITFAGGLVWALILGFVAHRLKLSPIVGYLLAGVIVGPFTPGFVADGGVADQFAEFGVILLLFGIGLRFHLRELLAVWRVVIPGALIQATCSALLLAVLMRLMGWDWTSAIILGMGITRSSTVVMAKVLGERHDLHGRIGHIALGWTVVEDLIAVTLLLLLPILFGQSASERSAELALGLAALKVVGLVGVVVVLGKWVVPWALERIEKTRSRELFTLAVLVLAVGIAVGSAKIFGVSMALGAFLAGLAVGRSEFAARAAGDAMPMRDAFAVLFFVSVGMLFDPLSLIQVPHLIVAVLVVVLLGKPLIAYSGVRILGVQKATAVPVAAALSQVGEFCFILGTLARQLGLLSDAGWNALVATSIISIALNPAIYRWSRRRVSRVSQVARPTPAERPPVDPDHCVLVGFGPVGRIVHHLLRERGKSLTVIDLNLDTVRELKAQGMSALYGDVLRPDTLEEAGIARAASLILSADVEDAAEIIRQARLLNPELRVFVRCTHLRDAAALKGAGADVVAAGEAEVGVALVEAMNSDVMRDCGAQEDQRQRVREHLYNSNIVAVGSADEHSPEAPVFHL